ncbi:uncharacterized protein [Haliotis cracherodii]|uniref:uncharacterized protein isoform X1 n=2 Tax=Haliotis cracherodii TaxID=6455 RepID=UPI0039E937C3
MYFLVDLNTPPTTMTWMKLFYLTLAVTAAVLIVTVAAADDDEDASSGLCNQYNQNVTTRPNNKPKRFQRKNINFEIISVHNIWRDPNTVYWCDFSLEEEDGIKQWRHYDFNATHWWVEKGCSGTFVVEECNTKDVTNSGPRSTAGKSPMQGTLAAPKPVTNWMNIMSRSRFDMGTWDKEGLNML